MWIGSNNLHVNAALQSNLNLTQIASLLKISRLITSSDLVVCCHYFFCAHIGQSGPVGQRSLLATWKPTSGLRQGWQRIRSVQLFEKQIHCCSVRFVRCETAKLSSSRHHEHEPDVFVSLAGPPRKWYLKFVHAVELWMVRRSNGPSWWELCIKWRRLGC